MKKQKQELEDSCRTCKSFSRCNTGGWCVRHKRSTKKNGHCPCYSPAVSVEYEREAKPVGGYNNRYWE